MDEKRAVVIIFIVVLILILTLEYSNYTTEKRLEYEREKIERRLQAVNEKDLVENKENYYDCSDVYSRDLCVRNIYNSSNMGGLFSKKREQEQ